MLGDSIYAYVWRTSRIAQIKICLIVSLVTFFSVVPLELQRRIIDSAVSSGEVLLLFLLGGVYLLVLLVQGGLKYGLNLLKGRVQEEVSRELRRHILQRKFADVSGPIDSGTTISMLSAESEDIGEFASTSLSTPLLQGGTIIWVMAYLIWLEPRIALLAIVIYAPQAFLTPKIQSNVNRLARRRTRTMRRLGHEAVSNTRVIFGLVAETVDAR